MKSGFVSGATIAIVCAVAGTALAQGVPAGPFSSWSEAQKQQAGKYLGEYCPKECGSYMAEAKSGVVRASYEAAACVAACFVNNLPEDYPGIAEIKKSALTNYEQARKLGSGYAPRFVPGHADATPAPAPAAIETAPKPAEPRGDCPAGQTCAGAAR